MNLGNWYETSEFTFTLTADALTRSDDAAQFVGRLAKTALPGDNICEGCYTTIVPMEP